jgi:hypothetical protein
MSILGMPLYAEESVSTAPFSRYHYRLIIPPRITDLYIFVTHEDRGKFRGQLTRVPYKVSMSWFQ